jgi:hypothetical protein
MTDDVRGYSEEALRRTLAMDPRVLEPELEVAIVGDRIEVRGVVPTEARRRAVEQVLAEEVGDVRIENLTEVASFPPPIVEERVRR